MMLFNKSKVFFIMSILLFAPLCFSDSRLWSLKLTANVEARYQDRYVVKGFTAWGWNFSDLTNKGKKGIWFEIEIQFEGRNPKIFRKQSISNENISGADETDFYANIPAQKKSVNVWVRGRYICQGDWSKTNAFEKSITVYK